MLLKNLKGLSLSLTGQGQGQGVQQSSHGHDMNSRPPCHTGISDISGLNTDNSSDRGQVASTHTHSKTERETESESRNSSGGGGLSGQGSGSGTTASTNPSSSSALRSCTVASSSSSNSSNNSSKNTNMSISISPEDDNSKCNGQRSTDTSPNSFSTNSGKNNRANVRTLMEGPWAQDSSTSLNPSRPSITVISSQDYPLRAVGCNSDENTAGLGTCSSDIPLLDTSVSKKCKIDETI